MKDLPQAALRTRVETCLAACLDEGLVVGGALRLLQDGETVLAIEYGLADREAGRKTGAGNLFRLASLTKLYTAVAVLRLVARGILRPDQPVTDFLPDFRPALPGGDQPEITLRQLLLHTSGLNYGFLEAADGPMHRLGVSDGMDAAGHDLTENVARIAAAGLSFAPGQDWRYAVGYDVLGLALQAATGLPLAEVIAAEVCAPLGLTDSRFVVPDADAARLVRAYGPDGAPLPDPASLPFAFSTLELSPGRALRPQAMASAGAGMIGSADDLARLLAAIAGGAIPGVPDELAALFLTDQLPGTAIFIAGEGWGWSLGGQILRDPASSDHAAAAGFWKWGGLFGNHFWVDPARGQVLVSLSNTAINGTDGDFPRRLRAAITGE